MTSHRTIMTNAGRAVVESEAVRDYCVQHFGRGLAVNVGAYPQGIPGESDAPFLWLIPADDENESVAVDQTFTVRGVLGGLVKGENGEMVLRLVESERTATANGLAVNGGNKVVEDLRDMILCVIRDAKAGARVLRIRRQENDMAHFPLEWAEFFVEYVDDVTL